MSISITKAKDVTVVTIKANSSTMCSPLCQILGALCYSPVCFSMHKELMNPCVTTVFGTTQIMLGLFNIALGPGREFVYPFADLAVPYWLGVMYITVGVVSIMAGQFPSFCMVGLSISINIAGALIASVGIALYKRELAYDDYYDFLTLTPLANLDIASILLAFLQLCLCNCFAVLGFKAIAKKMEEKGDKAAEDLLL